MSNEANVQIIASTTEDRVELLKARTTKRGFKLLMNESAGNPFMVENVVVFSHTALDEEPERPMAAIKVEGVYYSGVAQDIVDTCLNIVAVNDESPVLPIGCRLSKSAGRYGKFMLELE